MYYTMFVYDIEILILKEIRSLLIDSGISVFQKGPQGTLLKTTWYIGSGCLAVVIYSEVTIVPDTVTEHKSEQNPYGTLLGNLSDFWPSTVVGQAHTGSL